MFHFPFGLLSTTFTTASLKKKNWPSCEACGILASQPGIEPTPPALEGEILTTGPSGKSLRENFYSALGSLGRLNCFCKGKGELAVLTTRHQKCKLEHSNLLIVQM